MVSFGVGVCLGTGNAPQETPNMTTVDLSETVGIVTDVIPAIITLVVLGGIVKLIKSNLSF